MKYQSGSENGALFQVLCRLNSPSQAGSADAAHPGLVRLVTTSEMLQILNPNVDTPVMEYALLHVRPAESVKLTVNENVPVSLDVPPNNPEESSVIPMGKVPDKIENAYGDVPPEAVNWNEYAIACVNRVGSPLVNPITKIVYDRTMTLP